MRITKDAEVRKNEILDAAQVLFTQKGYDATTISDIIEKLGVARGLVYYHFKSKEDVLDALVERIASGFFTAAKAIAKDKSIPVLERLLQALMVNSSDKINVADKNGMSEFIQQAHKPQNALMHQKSHDVMMKFTPPILMPVVEEGIQEGLFNTPYPYECIEMVIAYINTVFDEQEGGYTQEELSIKVNALIFNLDRLFGAAPGSFDVLREMFGIGDELHE